MTIDESHIHEEVFFKYWERLISSMPDDVLESTIYMIKEFDDLNLLVKQEYGYRKASMEL